MKCTQRETFEAGGTLSKTVLPADGARALGSFWDRPIAPGPMLPGTIAFEPKVGPRVNSEFNKFTYMEGRAAALEWLAEKFNESQLEKAIADGLEGIIPDVTEALDVTGNSGVLLQLDIQKSIGLDGKTIRKLLGTGLRIAGSGEKPFDVVVLGMQQDRLITDEKEGWFFDPDTSSYLWMKRGADGKIVSAEIAPVLRKGMAREAAILMWDQDVQRALRNAQSLRTMDALAAAAERRAIEIEQANEIRQIRATMAERDRQLREIDRKLRDELKRQADLATGMMAFRTLEAVLGVAAAVSGLVESLGADAPPELKNAVTKEQVEEIVKGASDRNKTIIEEATDDLRQKVDQQNLSIERMRQKLDKLNIPSQSLQPIELGPQGTIPLSSP